MERARAALLDARSEEELWAVVQWIAISAERREVTAVSAARATPALGLEVQEVGPIETPRHEDTVYLPATTVPPTVVALRPKRAETAAREPGPLVGPVRAAKYLRCR